MKKIATTGLLFLCLTIAGWSESSKTGLYLKLSGGAGWLQTGDHFQSLYDSTESQWSSLGYTGSPNLDFSRWLPDFTVTGIWQLTDMFGLGIGAGFIGKSWVQNPEMDYPAVGGGHLSGDNRFEVQAIPVTLEGILSLPIGPIKLSVRTGASFYLTRLKLNLLTGLSEPGRPGAPGWKETISQDFLSGWSQSLGFHTGVGLEIPVTSGISLQLEALYRRASIDEFIGRLDQIENEEWNGGSSTRTKGSDAATAWFRGVANGGETWYDLVLSEEKPDQFFCLSPFKVDLSGFYFMLGVKIKI